MTRLRINGVEEEVAVTTVGELLAARGVDPAARFLAVAVNGSVVRRSEWPSQIARARRRRRNRPALFGRLRPIACRANACPATLSSGPAHDDRSVSDCRHRAFLPAFRRHCRLPEPAGAARLPRGERRGNRHGLDPPHQPRRLRREPGRSARRPLSAAAEHRRLRHRARRGSDRRAGARGARDGLGQARADRRPRDRSTPMSSSWSVPPTNWCAAASPCFPIATRTR